MKIVAGHCITKLLHEIQQHMSGGNTFPYKLCHLGLPVDKPQESQHHLTTFFHATLSIKSLLGGVGSPISLPDFLSVDAIGHWKKGQKARGLGHLLKHKLLVLL